MRAATDGRDAPGTRRRRLAAPVGALAGVAVTWAAVALIRPGDAGPTPCAFRSITGLDCPFCGSTRAAACLASGDVLGALDHNALFVVGILPVAVVAWLLWMLRAWRGDRPITIAPRVLVAALAVTGIWWAVRLVVPWLGSSASI